MAPLFLILVSLPLLTSSGEDPRPLRREVYGGGRIIDVTHRVSPESLVWGNGGAGLGQYLRLRRSIKNGNNTNSSVMNLSVHTGTHVDAPGHFIDRFFDAGFDVDSLDLDVLIGPGLLVDVPRDKNKITELKLWNLLRFQKESSVYFSGHRTLIEPTRVVPVVRVDRD